MGTSEDELFIDKIYEFVEQDYSKVIVDLSAVTWMNSRGLGMCLKGLTTLRNRGGDLRLANLSQNGHSLMEKCRILTIFQSFDSIEKAVDSFK